MDAKLKIDFLTLFPNMLSGFLGESMLARAQEAGILDLKVHDIRDWATSKHKNVDDRPFGGGPGMLLMPEPIFAAIEALQTPECTRIYMCPDGEKLSPKIAAELSQKKTSDNPERTLRRHRPTRPRLHYRQGDFHWRLRPHKRHASRSRLGRHSCKIRKRRFRRRKFLDV